MGKGEKKLEEAEHKMLQIKFYESYACYTVRHSSALVRIHTDLYPKHYVVQVIRNLMLHPSLTFLPRLTSAKRVMIKNLTTTFS